MPLTVTLVIAAAVALINLWLALRISRHRLAGISLGDGGDPLVAARVRAHGNLMEYAPIVLILLALIELARGPSGWLWLAGGVFVVGRLLHPLGLERPAPNPLRASGIVTTWLVMLGLAAWALAIAYDSSATPPAGLEIETITPSA